MTMTMMMMMTDIIGIIGSMLVFVMKKLYAGVADEGRVFCFVLCGIE